MQDFEFSDDLREKVEESLIERIANAIGNDSKLAHQSVKYGMPSVVDMTAEELMGEYCNWHGLYDCDGDLESRDRLLSKMIQEINSYKLEKELLSEESNNDASDS